MYSRTLTGLLLLSAITVSLPAAPNALSGIDHDALRTGLRSAIARTVYDEYVAEVITTFETQAGAFRATPKEVGKLPPEILRAQLATIESLTLTRSRISQSRRAVLGCAQLTREEAELLLGQLLVLKSHCERLLNEEVPARKDALVAAITQAPPPVVVVPVVAPTDAASTADVIAAAKRQLRPTGIVYIDSTYQLMLDGKRAKTGDTIKVRLGGEHSVTITAVTKNSYTLAFAGESVVVPME